ncbi:MULTISPECIES: chemoreceptor glutamine deamidase CheD [Clostridium]|jgi:chemotaxis protein CheD|uniref:Probable chemoreceptor glutamine deamidase CheD n=3 Tax=Clostridium intestinale TaxID=36845 RepID=U2NRY0_9CLOT|nr:MULTISPECIES: chemoreceptor glutamine deamidase CheD [Clostridium]ERK31933.1 chemoreceptor glutamine deamidase CheD [Clostridium intestinale URNW]QLY78785.1 chemotaxis protein CheD [Clostridium intestinale]SHI04624.1 chemotaxis protein CheD [Clostridium intestinale DSM 6191]
MQSNEIKVGIADLNIVNPPGKIMTIGLGSCIGIALYDNIKKIAGLAHIMLPDSKSFKNVTNPYKFADLAIPILMDKMQKEGCSIRHMKAKIVGGASMFNFSDKTMINDIGKRNAEAVIKSLGELKIPIIASDVGGNKGRTMIVDPQNGVVIVRTIGQETKEI